MSFIDILLVIVNIVVTSLGAIILKIGATKDHILSKLSLIFSGLSIYVLMSFITVYLYSRYSLILVQVLLSFTYIVTPFLAYKILGEKLPVRIWIGIILIVLGITAVSYGLTLN